LCIHIQVGDGVFGHRQSTYLLLMVQALVVVLKDGHAFGLARVVLGVCVGDVAGEDFLPEGEAARGAWEKYQQEFLERLFSVVESMGGACGGAEQSGGLLMGRSSVYRRRWRCDGVFLAK
jgi:hypothetical protein